MPWEDSDDERGTPSQWTQTSGLLRMPSHLMELLKLDRPREELWEDSKMVTELAMAETVARSLTSEDSQFPLLAAQPKKKSRRLGPQSDPSVRRQVLIDS